MPGSYHKLLYHIVFSTKRRARLISPDLEARLHDYLGGIIRNQNGSALQIGGAGDHIHLLVRWRADEALANLLRDVKSRSSAWVHESFPEHRGFGWQEGYAAFTVSPSQVDGVAGYVRSQAEHHRRQTFEEELEDLLRRAGIEYELRYLFD